MGVFLGVDIGTSGTKTLAVNEKGDILAEAAETYPCYYPQPLWSEHDPEDWWKVVDTNLGGTFHLVQAVLPHMRARGSGRIVVVTSEWGITGWPGATAYAASKAGLVSLVKTLGRELAPEGIIVNAIAPGVTDTPQLEVDARDAGTTLEEMHRRYAAGIPLGRIGTADEMAAVVALLAAFRMSAMVDPVV